MLGAHQEAEAQSAAFAQRKLLLSAAMKRASEWISSQEVPTDVTVQVGEANFLLHKFPLVSKCGYIGRVITDNNHPNMSLIQIPNIPGGAEAFEFVTKFCYGVNFEITLENVAVLRCASEYLEMTEDYADGNLISRLEAYLEEVVFMNLSGTVTVLHKSEDLLPMSEEIKLVSRCIDAIAYLACNDNQFLSDEDYQGSLKSLLQQPKSVDWWAEELTVLRVETFQRVLMAMKARGFDQYASGPILMLYAQKSLRGLDIFGRRRSKKIEAKEQHEKRVVLETVVSLLPTAKNAISVSFLSLLLRAAIYLDTTVACRLDLEKRMSLQLGNAVLDDLLIPTFSINDDTTFDVETVRRILVTYLEHEAERSRFDYNVDGDFASPLSSDLEQVRGLMESYLSEISSDPKLTVAKFVSLAELIPEQARLNEDGMYRAIDIYLKVHSSLTEAERKKVCSMMNCHKLSRQACAHAAQNSRLPSQIVVQVLHYEQQRYRGSMSAGAFTGEESPAMSSKSSRNGSRFHAAPPDELSRLQRENDELKLQIMKMRVQLNEAQKPSGQTAVTAGKPPLPKKSVINSLSKKLISPFLRSDGPKPSAKTRTKPPKDRRHSIS